MESKTGLYMDSNLKLFSGKSPREVERNTEHVANLNLTMDPV
jgi:hypothetical protein